MDIEFTYVPHFISTIIRFDFGIVCSFISRELLFTYSDTISIYHIFDEYFVFIFHLRCVCHSLFCFFNAIFSSLYKLKKLNNFIELHR